MFSVSCHPQKPEIVAIGCKLGLVLIVNIDGTGRIHQRMRGHDEDVYGVSWSPCQGISIGDQSFEEWLLVSSSRDKTLRVWSEKEGRSVHMIRIPAPDRRQGGKDAAWISCHWQSPSIILSSGVSGELLAWHLDKPAKKGGSEWFVVTREHFKNLFSIGVSDSGRDDNKIWDKKANEFEMNLKYIHRITDAIFFLFGTFTFFSCTLFGLM